MCSLERRGEQRNGGGRGNVIQFFFLSGSAYGPSALRSRERRVGALLQHQGENKSCFTFDHPTASQVRIPVRHHRCISTKNASIAEMVQGRGCNSDVIFVSFFFSSGNTVPLTVNSASSTTTTNKEADHDTAPHPVNVTLLLCLWSYSPHPGGAATQREKTSAEAERM